MKPVVGVFAHPDDEIFAGGTLATFAQERDVYLICLTNGEAGINSSSKPNDLGELRKDELQASAKILGIKEVFFLNFPDGELTNNLYSIIANKIRKIIQKLDPEILLTFDPRGVSGHADHVITALITSYIFEKTPTVQQLWYYGFDEAERAVFKKHFEDFFVYIPPGFKKEEISKTIDASPVWEKKIAAMQKHETQKHDIEKLIEIFAKQNKEYFVILNKNKE